ncbi:cell envelope integrity EipB family protein [Rhizobium setariae]|uniref:cell envelope integrity EipB family protein n=1 Tax=Rhizobium setariae TaxID=2801340 RepID=UPI0031BA258E
MSRSSLLACTIGACLASSGVPALSQGIAGLVPHRAVYNLELKDASERSGINNMFGRMVYEFTGSACEGYRVSFRFVTQVETASEKKVTDQQSTTFEDPKTGRFEFESKTFNDDRLDKEVAGLAERRNDKLAVDITMPAEKKIDLTAARFPTQHTIDVIERAKRGDHFFEARIYDGSEDGDKTLFTSTIVGSPVSAGADDPDASGAGKLKAEKTWPVTIAYFDDNKDGDSQPNYRMSFKLYENGVSRDLTMDYGDFVLKGNLVKLDFLPEETCKSN